MDDKSSSTVQMEKELQFFTTVMIMKRMIRWVRDIDIPFEGDWEYQASLS